MVLVLIMGYLMTVGNNLPNEQTGNFVDTFTEYDQGFIDYEKLNAKTTPHCLPSHPQALQLRILNLQ